MTSVRTSGRLIIVCGAPGSGKTTLARALSCSLSVACIHKDTIKETLYDALRCATLEESKNLGAVAMKALFVLAQQQCARCKRNRGSAFYIRGGLRTLSPVAR